MGKCVQSTANVLTAYCHHCFTACVTNENDLLNHCYYYWPSSLNYGHMMLSRKLHSKGKFSSLFITVMDKKEANKFSELT